MKDYTLDIGEAAEQRGLQPSFCKVKEGKGQIKFELEELRKFLRETTYDRIIVKERGEVVGILQVEPMRAVYLPQ
jgi:hypothetical protein